MLAVGGASLLRWSASQFTRTCKPARSPSRKIATAGMPLPGPSWPKTRPKFPITRRRRTVAAIPSGIRTHRGGIFVVQNEAFGANWTQECDGSLPIAVSPWGQIGPHRSRFAGRAGGRDCGGSYARRRADRDRARGPRQCGQRSESRPFRAEASPLMSFAEECDLENNAECDLCGSAGRLDQMRLPGDLGLPNSSASKNFSSCLVISLANARTARKRLESRNKRTPTGATSCPSSRVAEGARRWRSRVTSRDCATGAVNACASNPDHESTPSRAR
jgi:hypothetical protein